MATYCKLCEKKIDELPSKHWEEKHTWIEVFKTVK